MKRYSISDLGRMDNLPNRTTISGWVSEYEDIYGDNSFRSRGHKAPGGAVTYDVDDINELLRFKGYEPLSTPRPVVEVVDEPEDGEIVSMPDDIVFNPSKVLGYKGGVVISAEAFEAISTIAVVATDVVKSATANRVEETLNLAREQRKASRALQQLKESLLLAEATKVTTDLIQQLTLDESKEMNEFLAELNGGKPVSGHSKSEPTNP